MFRNNVRHLRHKDYLAWKKDMDKGWDLEDEAKPLHTMLKKERIRILKSRYSIKKAVWDYLMEHANKIYHQWAYHELQQHGPEVAAREACGESCEVCQGRVSGRRF